jgi:hypothetical protein
MCVFVFVTPNERACLAGGLVAQSIMAQSVPGSRLRIDPQIVLKTLPV